MISIILQAKQALYLSYGYYKTGTHIVGDLIAFVQSQVSKIVFLTQNIQNPADYIVEILNLMSEFKLLTKSRAGELYAGKGPLRDVCIACVNLYASWKRLQGLSCIQRQTPISLKCQKL